MFGKTQGQTTGAIVLGVTDDAASRQAVREAAIVAVEERKILHLVTSHDLQDSYVHRAARSVSPHDVEYMVSPHGDGEALIADLAELVSASGVTIVAHVHKGSLRAAVRRTTKMLASMPAPVASPAPARRPAPAPVPMPTPEVVPAAVAAVPPSRRFRREPVAAEEVATAPSLAEAPVPPPVVAGS